MIAFISSVVASLNEKFSLTFYRSLMVDSVVSLAILCQFLCITAVSSLPKSEKGLTMGKILVSVCEVCWDNS